MTVTLVVDANNLLMRAMRATEALDLEADGVPTASTVAFVGSLSRYIRHIQPTHVAVCWDGGHDRRTEVFPEYKSGRGVRRNQEEEDRIAFILAKEFLSLSGFYHAEIPGIEADDLIAMYWRQRDPGQKFVILSGDKDFMQLLDENVVQVKPTNANSKTFEEWDIDRVRQAHGAEPKHLPKMMALAGDATDGVIGIRGIAWKKAKQLLALNDWDLEQLFEHGNKNIVGNEDRVRLNLRLVNLREDEGMCDVTLPPIPAFHPTDRTSILHTMLLEYLGRLMLSRIEKVYLDGNLWNDPPQLDFSS